MYNKLDIKERYIFFSKVVFLFNVELERKVEKMAVDSVSRETKCQEGSDEGEVSSSWRDQEKLPDGALFWFGH